MIPEFIESRFTEDTKKDIKALCSILLIIYVIATIGLIAYGIYCPISKGEIGLVFEQIISDPLLFCWQVFLFVVIFIVINPLVIYFGLQLIMYAFILVFKLIQGAFAK